MVIACQMHKYHHSVLMSLNAGYIIFGETIDVDRRISSSDA